MKIPHLTSTAEFVIHKILPIAIKLEKGLPLQNHKTSKNLSAIFPLPDANFLKIIHST
jgi:hypothetical protein